MQTEPSPKNGPKRVALTVRQAADGFGRALCENANNLLADGKLDTAEAAALEEWLEACGDTELPALNYLREEVRRFAADGQLLPWELGRLQLALERILPPADRAIAKAARKKAEAEYTAREGLEPEQTREAKRIQSERKRESGSIETVTKAQMKFIEDLGGAISMSASKDDASELISRLLAEQDLDSPAVPLPDTTRSARDHDVKLKNAIAGHEPKPGQTIYDVSLPPRQPYEGRATLKQKDYLWGLGLKDQYVIDSLGKRQASALIDQIKAQHKSGCASIIVIGVVIAAAATIAKLA
jgi:hypothetical protein